MRLLLETGFARLIPRVLPGSHPWNLPLLPAANYLAMKGTHQDPERNAQQPEQRLQQGEVKVMIERGRFIHGLQNTGCDILLGRKYQTRCNALRATCCDPFGVEILIDTSLAPIGHSMVYGP